ncbi:MAG: PKD domain-containing protein [Bacteroidetes bacterium]|nr:PKD domain-containing protein [Bacteroidota bacterium]
MKTTPAWYNWGKIEDKLCAQIGITQDECKDFLRYAAKYSLLGWEQYYQLVEEKSITKHNAQQYWIDKLPFLENLYRYKYLPAIAEERAARKTQPNQVQNASCNNLDFSSGNLSNWTGKWNNQGSSLSETDPTTGQVYGYGNLTVNGLNSNGGYNSMGCVQELCNGGMDRNVPINTVAPGHSYSLRLGDDSAYVQRTAFSNSGTNTVFPYNHQTISNTFMVTPTNKTITYWYAVVLDQAATAGHTAVDQPYFRIRMYDQSGNLINCASYDVNVDQAINVGGFQHVIDPTGNYLFYYKNWTPIFIPLNSYVGQNVTITFESSDCSKGGHFGYAYLTVDCAPLQLITHQPQPCIGGNTTMTAPVGLASYNWSGPGIVSGATAQTATVNAPGTYSVTMVTFSNAGQVGCTLVLSDTVIGSSVSPVASFTATQPCLHQATQFTDQSVLLSNQGTLSSFSWHFGDGTSSTASNPSHTYTTAGTFPVTYSISSSVGCSATYTANVVVNPLPAISFTAAPVCIGNVTSFTNTSTATTYTWNFGDGSGSSNTLNPTHTYANVGTFNVSLAATNSFGCKNVQSGIAIIEPYPVVLFSAPPACLGTPSQFSNSSSPATNVLYSWNFGDATSSHDTSSTKNPSYTYPQAGVYTPTLTVTSDAGCATTQSYTVQVKPIPSVVATLFPFTFCWKDTVPQPTLTTTPATNVNFYWANNNAAIGLGTSGVGAPPTFTAGINTTGTNMAATITITPIYNGCTGPPATYPILIKPTPIVVQPNLNYCPKDTVPIITFSTIPTAASANTTWTANITPFIGLSTTSGTTAVPSFYAIGHVPTAMSNVITVSDTYNGCVGPNTTFSITINPNPKAMFTYTNACSGNPTNFIDQSIANSGTISQWNWNFGTGTSTSPAPAYLLTPAGTYTVNLQVVSSVGCKHDTTETVVVQPSPTVSLSGVPLSGCPPLLVSFYDTVSVAPPVVLWNWNFGNGAAITYSNNTQPQMIYNNASHTQSSYYTIGLSVTANNGCVTTVSKNNYIQVYPRPKANFTYTPKNVDVITQQVQFLDQSIGVAGDSLNVPWRWNFGDMFVENDTLNSSVLQNPWHLYQNPNPGEYTVTEWIQNSYGCRDSISEIITVNNAVTFYIPNAFTPNNDGKNEFFKGTGIGIMSGTFTLDIFDRWGLHLFHAEDLETGWDGTYKGKACMGDVYVWKVGFEDVLLQRHELNGTVTLVR